MQTSLPGPKYFICLRTTQAARKLVRHYNRVLAPLGLTAQQAGALGILWREQNLSLGVFAKKAGIGKAAAVSMIKRLETMGLVTRTSHPQDARLNVIDLTDKARELAPKLAIEIEKLEKTLESAIGDSNLQTLLQGLSAISNLEL